MSAPAGATYEAETEATFEEVVGGWIGRLGDQRTMLKSSREWAEIDVQKERFVCDRWPLCSHRDAEHCGRATPRGLPRWRADE